MGAIGGGSLVAVLLLFLVGRFLGVDIGGMGGGGGGGSPSPSTATGEQGIPADRDQDRELVEFVNFVIDDVQQTFDKEFRRVGKQYKPAHLVLFTEAVDTGCGRADSGVGPFYCPADQRAYIDLSFYRVLREKLDAGGDFAQAYVLAHEIGHHVQNLLGTMRGARDNETSVRVELQADCLAGVWAHSTNQRRLLEDGDIQESMNAAAQIGDDALQRRGGGRVNPESWTHGSSQQRQRWFERGLNEGDIRACDTFSGGI